MTVLFQSNKTSNKAETSGGGGVSLQILVKIVISSKSIQQLNISAGCEIYKIFFFLHFTEQKEQEVELCNKEAQRSLYGR